MDKNKSIQAIRAIIYFSIVAFHFGLTGTQMMWGGGGVLFCIISILFDKESFGK